MERMFAHVHRYAVSALNLLYPSSCSGCLSASAEPGLCSECTSALLYTGSDRCRKCGSALGPHAGLQNKCPMCRNLRFHFKNAYALCRYEYPVKNIIHALKYGKDFSALAAIEQIIAEAVCLPDREQYDAVVPVPLHIRDRLKRGFNQAAEIGDILSSTLDIPIRTNLKKIIRTPCQVRLHRAERKRNLKNAFTCREHAFRNRRVLLVDDVLTTGSTLSECARVLTHKGKASLVDVCVLAR